MFFMIISFVFKKISFLNHYSISRQKKKEVLIE